MATDFRRRNGVSAGAFFAFSLVKGTSVSKCSQTVHDADAFCGWSSIFAIKGVDHITEVYRFSAGCSAAEALEIGGGKPVSLGLISKRMKTATVEIAALNQRIDVLKVTVVAREALHRKKRTCSMIFFLKVMLLFRPSSHGFMLPIMYGGVFGFPFV